VIAAAAVSVAAAIAGLTFAGQGSVTPRVTGSAAAGAARSSVPNLPGSVIVTAAPDRAVHPGIVVDGNGRTLYHLTGESTFHVRCADSCLRSWLPLTVTSPSTKLVEGRGVAGRLAIFRRPDGTLQVTLRGFLLYRFAGDRVAGQTLGNGTHQSGGVGALVLARTPKLPPILPPGGVPGPKLPPIPPPV
jgi:predicted lipoprotein with Yx(FWY)xxD motif